MHLLRVHRTFPKLKSLIRSQSTQTAALNQDEYTETPEYPPILDLSLQARKLRERQAVHQKIQKINTVEEKQIGLNMPRYYGFKCVMFTDDRVPYNAMPMVQCYTRTHFKPTEKLPDIYNETEQLADQAVKEIKSQIEDAIALELEAFDYKYMTDIPEEAQRENAIAKRIVKQINRIVSNNLADKVSHVLSAQVDYDPRHEAFWFVGGTDVPRNVYQWRKKYPFLKDRIDEPVDRPVQYKGSPIIAVRSHLPLKPILPYSEAENPEFKVPKFTYQPEMVGYKIEHRHGTNIPGFWPGDHDEFGLLSVQGRGYMLVRNKSFGAQDELEALHCQAMKSSFGWLCAQANYQGFTTYNDLTYPLATQTVITNGQEWSFYAYQLNTITMHNEQMDENPKHNICFGTKPQQLYETVENGKVKGLNENVLKTLVQFYLNTPEEREHDMKPYLGKEEQVVADIEDDKKRCWLEDRYKHIMANRPRHLLPPETFLWEKIYKIQHNTRFFEKKRQPWEYGINPYKRRLDEHLPPYIPKVVRPYPRSKKKFETTYYPDV
ncbi:39S ribosomal protein S30, mitochondrial [Pectinophora gossypiella]|uniref:39S ribosomal protein S30, mitochondrial n=1 Tax=Pectinophora gossypiella TaxID=13191 RepID=UPI00214F0A3F|nr:39S ribosomal protein S30, mitochondrial [Pectinophora gossypiella]